MSRWSPHHLPRLRRDLVRVNRFIAEDIPELDELARRYGTERIDPEAAGYHRREADALAAAELYWASRDMTRVALAASATLPEWTPAAARPTPFGLLVWDGGLPELEWRGAPEDVWTTSALGVRTPPMAPVDAVAWRPAGDGEVRLTVLTRTAGLPEGALVERWAGADLFAFGVVRLALLQPVPTTSEDSSAGLVAALGATWLLMMQPAVVGRSELGAGPDATTRPEVSTPRPDRAVTIIDLRRAQPADRDDSSDAGPARVYARRWLVRGYWRQQAVGPGRSHRRPTWVPPHVKGPAGAPMIETEHVYAWRR